MDYNFPPESGDSWGDDQGSPDIPRTRNPHDKETVRPPRDKRVNLLNYLGLNGRPWGLIFNPKSEGFEFAEENPGDSKKKPPIPSEKDRVEIEFESSDDFLNAADRLTPELFAREARASLPDNFKDIPLVLRFPWGPSRGGAGKDAAITYLLEMAATSDNPITIISSQDNDRNYARAKNGEPTELFLEHEHPPGLHSAQVPAGILLSNSAFDLADAQQKSAILSTDQKSPRAVAVDSRLLCPDPEAHDGKVFGVSTIAHMATRWVINNNIPVNPKDSSIGLTVLGTPNSEELKNAFYPLTTLAKEISRNSKTPVNIEITSSDPPSHRLKITGQTYPDNNEFRFELKQANNSQEDPVRSHVGLLDLP